MPPPFNEARDYKLFAIDLTTSQSWFPPVEASAPAKISLLGWKPRSLKEQEDYGEEKHGVKRKPEKIIEYRVSKRLPIRVPCILFN